MDEFMNSEISDRDLIVKWIHTSSYMKNSNEKLDIIHKLHEFLIRRVPNLLPEFLSNILDFATDKSADVKKVLVAFIEEACKINESLLPKVMDHLHMLLCVDSIPVQKRVIQATITIYRKMLIWLCKAPVITTEMEHAWNQLNVIKVEIVNMIDSDNDGVRTSSVKFLEYVVLLQTYPDQYDNKTTNDFSLEDVPLTLKIARRRKLEEEAHKIFDLLIKFNGSQHVSSANLFACIGALTNIARNRPEFMGKVIASIELLHSNMPPTLSSTQVNSVRKKLKTELCTLIKHHVAAHDYLENITTMLMELGYTQQEVQKMTPKVEERRKFVKRTYVEDQPVQQAKRTKFDNDVNTENQKMAIEINEKFVSDRLNIEQTVLLVLSTLPKLPATIPTQFKIDYGAFVKMGHVGDTRMLGKMLAIQLLEAGFGPGFEYIKNSSGITEKSSVLELGKKKDEDEDKNPKKDRAKVPRIKTLKLSEITKPLEKNIKEQLLLNSVQRILAHDKVVNNLLRQKVIVTLAASFSESVRSTVLSFIVSDLRSNLEIALGWLFEEYSIMQGFTRLPAMRREGRLDQGYVNLLSTFISVASADALVLSQLMLEAPMITDQALEQLCSLCRDEIRYAWALELIKDLVIRRPPKQSMFLNALLQHTTNEINDVRECAINHIVELYQRQNLKSSIEKFAQLHLDFLRLPQPPMSLFGENQGRLMSDPWNDDLVRCCLLPYISILPINSSLMHNLAKVYIQTNADTKRVILRLLEAPVRQMGMDSVELLKLVEECPKGSETLVTRVIHILTDKGHPSHQLVQHVRDLYQTRVSDVRFLIPVLNGLSKQEIIGALPKLIKLNPVVVREVFNRLLGLHGDSPITPTELLVALHLIDPSKADLKTTMKATSMCLSEKQVFTQEVLAVVLQQLMDQTPLPTLLMRTVIQALSSHPRLSGFVMNILQRLILKQVWKQKVVWEGFVKCCVKTRPQSFSVLMQLPAVQLTEALSMCPELREPLKQYLQSFSEGQRTHIPSSVQDVLVDVPTPVPPPNPQKPPEMVPPPPLGSLEPLPPGMD